jgi:hypothetical protein
MNGKQLTLLLVLLVVLGGAGLLIYNKQNQPAVGANPELGKKLLGDLPVNEVAQIALKQGATELNLVKKDDLWRVRERNDYPANFSEISDFLLKARDLKIVQSEKVGASQLPRYCLVPGPGTNAPMVVELKGKDAKTIKTLLLGKKHMHQSARPSPSPYGDMGGEEGFPDGRYVKVGPDSSQVILISDALANLEPKPDQWLNKDFFKVEKVRSISVAFPVATNSWKVSRETETGEWKLAEAKADEKLDSSKTSALSNPLSAPTFADVNTTAKPEELGLDKPTLVTLDTFDNLTYTLKVGTKTNDNFPMTLSLAAQLPKERTPGKDEKAEDKARLDKEFKDKQKKIEEKVDQEKKYEKWTYLVSNWTLDPVLKERSQLLVEKKEEPKKDTASSTNAPPKTAIEPAPAPTDSSAEAK